MSSFDNLPDCLILRILQYTDFTDRQHISKVNSRLENLCYDMSLVRNTNLEGCYDLIDDTLKRFIQHTSHYITVLNLNHCYWLTQRCLQSAIKKCVNLKELHVIQCNLKIDLFVSILADLLQLQSISFSINSFTNIKKEIFTSSSHILKQLKCLHIFYNSRELHVMSYIGEHETLLDYCENLEELTIDAAEMSIPELYRPVVSCPNKLLSFKGMRLSNNIHAGAQMLFYGTLVQLPNTRIKWQTLLMPNVNFGEFTKKSEFLDCLKSVGHFRNLDISGSLEPLTSNSLSLADALELRYLNVARTLVSHQHLSTISSACRHLTSLNLFECDYIFYMEKTLNVEGFSDLLRNCCHLRHLNIGGSHHHTDDRSTGEKIKSVLSSIKGLLSLAIPICMLCEWTGTHSRQLVSSSSSRNLSPGGRMSPAKRFCQEGAGNRIAHDAERESSLSSQKRVLENIIENNPGLRSLEIISVGFVSSVHKNKFVQPKQQQFSPCQPARIVSDESLLPIHRLRHLSSLTLVGAAGLKGSCLVEIAKSCTQLRRLSIGFLGSALKDSNSLSNALEYMTSLKDLRIEQPYLPLNQRLFSSLYHCCCLQRLCIFAKGSGFRSEEVMQLMDKCSSLVVLQLFTDGTLVASRSLSASLNKRFSKSRPALSVCIHPLLDDRMKDVPNSIPAKHFSELTRFSSFTCSLPPSPV